MDSTLEHIWVARAGDSQELQRPETSFGVSRQLGATFKPRMKFWSTASGDRSGMCKEVSELCVATRGGAPRRWIHSASAGYAVSYCGDRDHLVFCFRACTMIGHFLDELLPVDQAVVVKGIMDKAGMVKPIDIFLAFLARDEASCLRGSWLPGPGPRSGRSRTVGCYLAGTCFLPRCVNPSSWKLPSADRFLCCYRRRYRMLQRCRSTTRPRRPTLADENLREPGRHPRCVFGSSRASRCA